MKHSRALGALIIAATLGVTACGSDPAQTSSTATKTINVTMVDNEFAPRSFDAAAGQKVTFRFTNDGSIDHEAILGTEAEQAAHETEMSAGASMRKMDHGGAVEGITVKPGETATLTRTFDAAGTMTIGCHEPGHYAAGMKATITIT